MTPRKLGLGRESLSALTTDDLYGVVAAASGTCGDSCLDPRCNIAIAYSVKPTCQESICRCPTD